MNALGHVSQALLSRLRAARHWVFDLDGTLTVAMHDFEALRRAIGCPPGAPILEWLANLSEPDRTKKTRLLDELEAELCDHARAAEGALALVRALRDRGRAVGILTRNSRDNALRTLRAIELAAAFDDDYVLGRDEAPAKPDPAGLLSLARAWGAAGSQLVMVGDFRFDLEAGRAAGALTVHVRIDDRAWPEHTDVSVASLAELCHLLEP